MHFSCCFFFIGLLLLFGCASVPNNELAQVSKPISFDEVTANILENDDFIAGSWPSQMWWESFNDPQLNALIEEALSTSPTLLQAQAKVEFADQMAKLQRSSLWPKLDMKYEEQWEYFSKNGFVRSFYPVAPGVQISPTTNQIDLTLNFSYEFDFWGKNRKKFQAALGQARASAAEKAQAELVLAAHIAQSYFELQAHLEKQEVLNEQLEQRIDLYELTNLRLNWGIDPAIPLLQQKKELNEIKKQLVAIKREIAFDHNQINMLVGKGPGLWELDLPLSAAFDEPFALPVDLSIDLLARRPDLQAQIWRVESAAKEIGVAKTEFYPNINLSAFGGLESLSFNDFFKWSSHMGGLTPALHLPIFTAGKLRANLRSKVASYNEAVYGYNDLLLHAAKEVADQMVLLKTKNEELLLQLSNLEVVSEEYELQSMRFEEGIDNYLTVLNTINEVLNQRLSVVELRKDHLLAVVKLIKAFGGGYDKGGSHVD